LAGAAAIVAIGIAASYAAWAQQPARTITAQQANTESAAAVAAGTPAPAAASAPTADVRVASRPSNSQAPVRTPTANAPQGPSVASEGDKLRLAFAKETVFDDRATVNGQPNPTYGKPVCRIVRDGDLFFDNSGRAEPGSIADTLRKLAANCQPTKAQGASDDTSRHLNMVTSGASDPIGAMLQSPGAQVNAVKSMKERLKDPEYRRQLLAQSRLITKDRYPDLARQLGLSGTEEERLLHLLADDEVARIAENPVPGGPVEESLRMIREFNQREEESIRAMLGGKYAQWQAYRQKRREPLLVTIVTAAVTSMSRQLADAGKPELTAEQSRTLTTALNAEAQRQDQGDQRILAANPADAARMMEENKHRWLDAIAAHVDAEQFAVLRKTWEH
jgi:hypothetical protein